MDKDYLVELTKNLYRLTLLFPKKEPLRYKMREVALEILEDSVKLVKLPTSKFKPPEAGPRAALGVLDSFFEVAKAQSWVSQNDILAIQKEYDNLKGELEKLENSIGIPSLFEIQSEPLLTSQAKPENSVFEVEPRISVNTMSERQEKILDFLRENGRAQVWQVKQVLPEVSKRTLRRDFEQMLNQGVVERIGERNDTFYQVKVNRG